MRLLSMHLNRFTSDFVNRVNKKDKKYSFCFFKPADFMIVNDSTLISVYEYRFKSSDVSEGAMTAAIVGSIIGLAAASFGGLGFVMIPKAEEVNYTGDLLVMNIDSSGSFYPMLLDKNPTPNYSAHNCFNVISKNSDLHFLYNDYILKDEKNSYYVRDLHFNSITKHSVMDTVLFADQRISYIENGSVYAKKEKDEYYLIGYTAIPVAGDESKLKGSYCVVKYFLQ